MSGIGGEPDSPDRRAMFDQVMKLAWQGVLPLSLLNILITGLVLALAGKL